MTSQAGSITQPIARSGPIRRHCLASGSTLVSVVLQIGRPLYKKYHHGIPFIAVTTAVSCPSSGKNSAALACAWCAFKAQITISCGPKSDGSSLAGKRATRWRHPKSTSNHLGVWPPDERHGRCRTHHDPREPVRRPYIRRLPRRRHANSHVFFSDMRVDDLAAPVGASLTERSARQKGPFYGPFSRSPCWLGDLDSNQD